MKKIVIIDLGQFGNRYIQGILQSSFDISIEFIASFEKSNFFLRQRYKELEHNSFIKEINFYDSIENLSKKKKQ